jgi:outer membrane biosynthesis protein TonB
LQRSYLVKSPVHFADFGFFVKIGDMLVHDTSNANRLTVYRNGEVIKAVKQTTLGLAAMQKNGFIEEVTQSKTAPKAPPKPAETPKPVPKREEPKPAPKPVPASVVKKDEEIEQKRKKAVPSEVSFDELPQHLKEHVAKKEAKKVEEEG